MHMFGVIHPVNAHPRRVSDAGVRGVLDCSDDPDGAECALVSICAGLTMLGVLQR
jgi:hypothetical protein